MSVTQAFNTNSSMGRLTLHALLSFAQFERDVTGERTRDKIAASKAKGMWMGGPRLARASPTELVSTAGLIWSPSHREADSHRPFAFRLLLYDASMIRAEGE